MVCFKHLGFFKHNWLIILAVLFMHKLSAQAPSCILQHYSTDKGLSHSGVMCMLEDHLGFMWFGTWDGLNRFDEYKFTNYKSRSGDSNSLSNNRIDIIQEDKFLELGSNFIQSFYVDKYKIVWIETNKSGIVRFVPENRSFKYFLLKTDVYCGNTYTFVQQNGDWVIRKFTQERETADKIYKNDVHIILYRTADIHLFLIEALNHLGLFQEAQAFLNDGVGAYLSKYAESLRYPFNSAVYNSALGTNLGIRRRINLEPVLQ